MLVFCLALFGFVLALMPALLFFQNLRLYRRPSLQQSLPPVSILIPARNEERSIATAIASIQASQGIEWELIILDDQSIDRTAEIVRSQSEHDKRIRYLGGEALPAGWCGKQYACFCLAQQAHNDILLFLDADVRVEPYGIASMVSYFVAGPAALVSGFPRQETGTFLEKLVIPLIHFLLLGFLPMRRMRTSTRSGYAAGCGQCFITSKGCYWQTGGHSAIRTSLHDGITLPRSYRQHGLSTDLFDGSQLATCRMYHTAREVWFGFAKNAREGMATTKMIVPITLLLVLGQIAPFFTSIYFSILLACPDYFRSAIPADFNAPTAALGLILSLLAVLASYSVRLVACYRFQQSLLGALLHPVGIALVLAIQWFAFLKAIFGRSSIWKGRAY